MNRFTVRLLIALFVFSCAGWLVAAPRVHLEVVGASSVAAHDWGRALAKVPFASVRIVSGQDSVPSIEVEESAGSRVYRVRGIVNDRNQLRLPQGSFAITNTKGIAEWIESLEKVRPVDQEKPPRLAFGLSARELVNVTDTLKITVRSDTKGRPARKVISEINGLVGRRISIDPAARAGIPADVLVEDELLGMSAGAALAAVLRPLGLVMVPGHSKRLLVKRFDAVEEHWPVGWPAEGPPVGHVPKLYESLEVEIADTPLSETVEVLQKRLEVPVLFDHNGMARQRISLKEIQASFPLKRTFYGRILKTVLSQGKLKYELRVDEAERPFLWISPSRSK